MTVLGGVRGVHVLLLTVLKYICLSTCMATKILEVQCLHLLTDFTPTLSFFSRETSDKADLL